MATTTIGKRKSGDEIRAAMKERHEIVQPSKKLEALLNSLKVNFKKLKKRVNEIFELARREGFPDEITGIMIRQKMEGEYTQRTITNVLPSTAKDMTKSHAGKKPSFSRSEENISPEPLNKSATNQEKSDTIISNDTDEDTPEANQKKAQLEMETGEIESGAAPTVKTDQFRTYIDTIAAKNKIIKELTEENQGLKKQLANKEKIISNQVRQIEQLKKQVKK